MAAAVFTQSVLAADVSPEHDDEEVKTTQNTRDGVEAKR